MRGLEVTFAEPLQLRQFIILPGNIPMPGGIQSRGAVFPFDILQSYNLEKGIIVLREDYEIQINSDNTGIFFRSKTPNSSIVFINASPITSIKDLANNKVLYPKQ